MPDCRKCRDVSAWIVVAVLAMPRDAHAYLDPGTGSMLIQGLIAAVLSAAFAVKLFWAKLKPHLFGFLSGRKQGEHEHDQAAGKNESDE